MDKLIDCASLAVERLGVQCERAQVSRGNLYLRRLAALLRRNGQEIKERKQKCSIVIYTLRKRPRVPHSKQRLPSCYCLSPFPRVAGRAQAKTLCLPRAGR